MRMEMGKPVRYDKNPENFQKNLRNAKKFLGVGPQSVPTWCRVPVRTGPESDIEERRVGFWYQRNYCECEKYRFQRWFNLNFEIFWFWCPIRNFSHFSGKSGYVQIDEHGNRQQDFIITSLDYAMNKIQLAEIDSSAPDGAVNFYRFYCLILISYQ